MSVDIGISHANRIRQRGPASGATPGHDVIYLAMAILELDQRLSALEQAAIDKEEDEALPMAPLSTFMPAPPVATTGAVPRDEILYLAEVVEAASNNPREICGPTMRAKAATVRRWLSAAPAPKASEPWGFHHVAVERAERAHSIALGAPKASEGEAKPITKAWPDRFDCANCGQGVKADEDGCCSMCGQDCAQVIDGEYVTDAQPHARAEGASVQDALDLIVDFALGCGADTERQVESVGEAEETLRRALGLSGSADGAH